MASSNENENSASCDGRNTRLLAMGEMAATLAHEIRNPLGSMKLYCSLLMRDLENQPPSQDLARKIHLGILHLESVIGNSLSFVSDVRLSLREIVDVQRYLEEVVSLAEQTVAGKAVPVTIRAVGGTKAVADPHQLKQVLINLLANSVDGVHEAAAAGLYSSDRHGSISIASDTSRPGIWQIEVMDNGIGIEAEKIERIFDPFYSTKARGTGLGMPTVYRIVRAHGGSIDIESKYGVFTRVVLRLKRDSEEDK